MLERIKMVGAALTVVMGLYPVSAAPTGAVEKVSTPIVEQNGVEQTRGALSPYVKSDADGWLTVRTPQGDMRVRFDSTSGTSTVIGPDGLELQYQLSGASTSALTGFDWSGVPCSMLLWIVGIIHSGGWAAAIPLILETGAVGAAIVAAIWGLGVDGFLALVGSQC